MEEIVGLVALQKDIWKGDLDPGSHEMAVKMHLLMPHCILILEEDAYKMILDSETLQIKAVSVHILLQGCWPNNAEPN